MITFAVICNSNTICSNYINNHCIIVTAIIISFKISTAIILSADRNNNNNDNYNNYNKQKKNNNTNIKHQKLVISTRVDSTTLVCNDIYSNNNNY